MNQTIVAAHIRAHVQADRSGKRIDFLTALAIGLACELPTVQQASRWLRKAGFGTWIDVRLLNAWDATHTTKKGA